MEKRLRALLEACLRPSMTMLVSAGTVVIAFSFWLGLASPRSLDDALSAYPGFSRLDDTYFLFHRMNRLRTSPRSGDDDVTRVAILGGSTIREALWSESTIAKRISEHAGRRVQVAELASGQQPFVHSWIVAERLTCEYGYDYVLLAANMARFASETTPRQAAQLGFRSNRVDTYLGNDAAATTGRFVMVSNPEFVLRSAFVTTRHAIKDLVGTSRIDVELKRQEKRHRFRGGKPVPEKRVLAKLTLAEQVYPPEFETFGEENKVLLGEIVDTVRQCGGEVVLADTPVHPWLLEAERFPRFAATYKRHMAWLEEFARARNLLLLRPNEAVGYSKTDLPDHGHLRDKDARRATSDFYADGLAGQIIADDRAAKGGVASWSRHRAL